MSRAERVTRAFKPKRRPRVDSDGLENVEDYFRDSGDEYHEDKQSSGSDSLMSSSDIYVLPPPFRISGSRTAQSGGSRRSPSGQDQSFDAKTLPKFRLLVQDPSRLDKNADGAFLRPGKPRGQARLASTPQKYQDDSVTMDTIAEIGEVDDTMQLATSIPKFRVGLGRAARPAAKPAPQPAPVPAAEPARRKFSRIEERDEIQEDVTIDYEAALPVPDAGPVPGLGPAPYLSDESDGYGNELDFAPEPEPEPAQGSYRPMPNEPGFEAGQDAGNDAGQDAGFDAGFDATFDEPAGFDMEPQSRELLPDPEKRPRKKRGAERETQSDRKRPDPSSRKGFRSQRERRSPAFSDNVTEEETASYGSDSAVESNASYLKPHAPGRPRPEYNTRASELDTYANDGDADFMASDEYVPSDADVARVPATRRLRPRRTRVPTLNYWAGERIIYGYDRNTGMQKIEGVHRVDNEVPDRKRRVTRKRHPAIELKNGKVTDTTLNALDGLLFDESRRKFDRMPVAKSITAITAEDNNTASGGRRVHIHSLFASTKSNPASSSIMVIDKGAALSRNAGATSYAFVLWTGLVEVKVHQEVFEVRRGGVFQVPSRNDFSIVNKGKYEACLVMMQTENGGHEGDIDVSVELARVANLST